MGNRIIKTIIRNILSTFQVLIVMIPIILQYLADKKMGVKRYLIFKKMVFSKEIFTPGLIFTFKLILILGVIIISILLIICYIKKINNNLLKPAIKVTILNLIAIVVIFSKQLEVLVTYHFFLIAIFIIVILQCVKAFFINEFTS